MKSLIRIMLRSASGSSAAPAFADLKVATSLTDLASVAQFVGGKHVAAQSLCKGYEDPHFVPAKPSLMKAIQHADVFVSVGPGAGRRLAAAGAAGEPQPQDPAGPAGLRGRVRRRRRAREADGHGQPRRGRHPPARQSALLPRSQEPRGRGRPSGRGVLASSTPRTRPTTPPTRRRSTSGWRRRSRSGRSRWRPTRARPIVTYHKNFIYFADRFGLKVFGTRRAQARHPAQPPPHRRPRARR